MIYSCTIFRLHLCVDSLFKLCWYLWRLKSPILHCVLFPHNSNSWAIYASDFESRDHLSSSKDDVHLDLIFSLLYQNVENFACTNLLIHRKRKENTLNMGKKILSGYYLPFVEVDIIWRSSGLRTTWQTFFFI